MIVREDSGVTQLHRGCILATIAHAIFTAHNPALADEQSWDGQNYNVQDSQGSLGTITFSSGGTVAGFFDANSSRNPFRSGDAYDLDSRLEEMPSELKDLAKAEALQYLIQEYEGSEIPLITAAFWNVGNQLAAAETWAAVMENGGHLVSVQLEPTEAALEAWRNHYSMSPQQIHLLRSLFERLVSGGNSTITLTDAEKDTLVEIGATGLDKSRELLGSIGIVVP